MTTQEKKDKIKKLTVEMLNDAVSEMEKSIDRALNSGAIDVDNWHESLNPMILPKTVLIAVLENEASQYYGIGTSFEKRVKKEVKNIKCFI